MLFSKVAISLSLNVLIYLSKALVSTSDFKKLSSFAMKFVKMIIDCQIMLIQLKNFNLQW